MSTHGGQRQRLNFISFTPGTSFEVTDSAGQSIERQLMFWLLREPWSLSPKKGTRVLHAYADVERFRKDVERFPERNQIHAGLAASFAAALMANSELKVSYDEIAEAMPRSGREVPAELNRRRNAFIGKLRRLLAQTCLQWLEPDLIILDEFQRFKDLLKGESDAAQLAHDLFNYEEQRGDLTTAARVLLLSATPYKMYTLQHEAEQDDHYADFRSTLDFLVPDAAAKSQVRSCVKRYREELFRLADRGPEGLRAVKTELEDALRKVIVRTERLAVKADRNGMLKEVATGAVLMPRDVQQYLSLQNVARSLEHDDVLEYWKAAPYLLNFMDNYDFKRRLRERVKSGVHDAPLVSAMRNAQSALLSYDDLKRYERIDPANSRLLAIHQDTIERGAWRLLWIPPSLPYYTGTGQFDDPQLVTFTKRLIFSCWKVVPKAIAALLSYDAERRMIQCFRRKAQNTPEARKKRRPLLRFTFSKGRPTGLPVLGMIYPSRTLAEQCDPLGYLQTVQPSGERPTLGDVLQRTEVRVGELLAPHLDKHRHMSGAEDESWYWAAPLLLDLDHDSDAVRRWFSQSGLAQKWVCDAARGEHGSLRGWGRHVESARQVVEATLELGPPPADLVRVIALLAIASPGVTAYLALSRITGELEDAQLDLRNSTAPLAHAFLHLFNLPEVIYMLRDRQKVVPYWKSVLQYCAESNLQSVLDEYAHVLVESQGLIGQPPAEIAAAVSTEIQRCVTLRTATAQADIISGSKRSVRFEEPIRLRTRFAMRFGDQEPDEGSEATRADHVRGAFNSPFWPFVLATTSVGQEGFDFHTYYHAVVHWNLPSNPVDLEQREGRVHRYKGHALRKNIAARHQSAIREEEPDPWEAMFTAARSSRGADQNDLFPFWIAPDGAARIERHVPMLPHSRDALYHGHLLRSLVLYRMVFGQNRQDDLVAYLMRQHPAAEVEKIVEMCRIDLSPTCRASDLPRLS